MPYRETMSVREASEAWVTGLSAVSLMLMSQWYISDVCLFYFLSWRTVDWHVMLVSDVQHSDAIVLQIILHLKLS